MRKEGDVGERDGSEKKGQHGNANQNAKPMAEKQTTSTPNQTTTPVAEKPAQHENEHQNPRQTTEKQTQETPTPAPTTRPSTTRRAAKSAKTSNTASPNLANIGAHNNKSAPARPPSNGAADRIAKSNTAAVTDAATTSAPSHADPPRPTAPAPSSPPPLSFNAHNKPIQANLSVSEYFLACCAHAVSVGMSSRRTEAQREFVVDFIKGLRETGERKRVVEGLEERGWATFERETRRVEFFCGWEGVVEVVGGMM